jgi:acyl carrier protein
MNVNNAGLDTESQVIKVLSEYFSMDRLNIQRGSRLVEDLYMDSMNLVETVMVLNEAFDTELPASQVAEWRTVADIISLVQSTSNT